MDISKRISFIADLINCECLADIGTDHGYLPITAIKRGKAKFAVACDINPKPLNKARLNIMEAGLSDNIDLRLGVGLKPIGFNEADCVVMSGMGGLLIKDIIEADINKAKSFKEIIVSPQSDIEAFRRFCHKQGFKINNEWLLKDDGKYYNILSLKVGADVYYDDIAYRHGRVLYENPNSVYLEFSRNEVKRIKLVMENIKNGAKTEGSFKRLEALNEEMLFYEKLLKSEE